MLFSFLDGFVSSCKLRQRGKVNKLGYKGSRRIYPSDNFPLSAIDGYIGTYIWITIKKAIFTPQAKNNLAHRVENMIEWCRVKSVYFDSIRPRL